MAIKFLNTVQVDTDVLYVDAANDRVGIGTTGPSAPLHINGGATSEVLKVEATHDPFMRFVENGTNVGFLQFTGGTAYLANMANGAFRFRTNNTDQMILTHQGRLGIGTTSPTSKLHVAGSGNEQIKLVGNTGRISINSASNSLEMYAWGNGVNIYSTQTDSVFFGRDAGVSNKFYYYDSSNVSTMLVNTSTGRVGIGTTNPSDKLEVYGGNLIVNDGTSKSRLRPSDLYMQQAGVIKAWLRADGNSYLNGGNLGIGTTSPSQKLEVSGNILAGGGSLNKTISFKRTDGFNLDLAKIITNGEVRIGGTNVGVITFNRSSSEVMRIASNSNVGIGTTSPDYELHVDPVIKIGDRQGTDGSLIIQSQQGPNITFTSSGDALNISGSTGSSNGNSIRLQDDIKVFEFMPNIGGTIRINRGNRGLMDTNIGGYVVQQQNTTASNGKSTFLSTDSGGTILRSTSYGGTGTAGDIQFQFGGGSNSSEPAPTTKMIIKNNGNVGIGTTSPGQKLEVAGNIQATGARNISASYDANHYMRIESNANGGVIKGTDGGVITTLVRTYGNSYFNGGNVGIGTSNPIEKLDITGQYGSTTLSGHVLGFTRASANYLWARTSGGDLRFTVNGNAVGSPSMTLSTAGNLGIGTTSPSQKLEVAGAVLAGDYRGSAQIYLTSPDSWIFRSTGGSERMRVTSAGNVGIGTTSPTSPLTIKSNSTSSSSSGLTIQSNGNTNNIFELAEKSTDGARLQMMDAGVTKIALYTDGTDNYINAGKVGIGTTSPAEKLHVNGEVRVDGNDGVATKKIRSSYFSSSQNLDLQSGSSADIILTSDKVGIGETSPDGKLHVHQTGSGTLTTIITEDDARKLFIGRDAINCKDLNNNAALLYLNQAGGNVSISNKLGIGTTSPTSQLDVRGGAIIAGSTPSVPIGTASTLEVYENGANATLAIHQDDAASTTKFAQIRFRNGGNDTYIKTPTSGQALIVDTEQEANAFVIHVNGKVGIGTTAPSYPLTVKSKTGNVGTAFFDSVDNWERIYIGSTNDYIERKGSEQRITFAAQGSNGTFTFQTSGSEKFRIANNGNVGIGTTSPSKKLDVAGDVKLTNGNSIYWRNAANNADIPLLNLNSNNIFNIGTTSSSVPVQMALHTAGLERIRITSDGKVGIGTTSPKSKLDVDGGVKIGDDTDTASANKVGTVRYRTSGNNSYVDMCMQTGATTYAWINIVQNNW